MYYYFATKTNLGEETTLEPRIPVTKMNNEDAITPRICVSQSINGCLTAISNFDIGDEVYIYECESNNVKQPHLIQVADRCFTGEQWILEPVKMKLFMRVVIIGIIDATINNMHNAMYAYRLCSY